MFQLPHAFSNSLFDKIFYNSAVDSVIQDGDVVMVNTQNGQQPIADRVLCTVPLPVLNNISISPALSEQNFWRQAADINIRHHLEYLRSLSSVFGKMMG
jgi:monoamine oxidase